MTATEPLEHLVALGRRLDALSPWRHLEDVDSFAIHLSGAPHPAVMCVMGAAGMEYGVVVYRGPGALAAVCALQDGTEGEAEVLSASDLLSLTLDTWGSLPPEAQQLYTAGGLRFNRGSRVPHLISKPPRKRPRNPTPAELHELTRLLVAFFTLWDAGRIQPGQTDGPEGIRRFVEGPGGDFADAWLAWPDGAGEVDEGADDVVYPLDRLRAVPHTREVWRVGWRPTAHRVENEEGEMRVCLVLSQPGDRLCLAVPTVGAGAAEAAHAILACMEGKGPSGAKGIPARVEVESPRLRATLTPSLQALGVEVSGLDGRALDALYRDFEAYFGRGNGEPEDEPVASDDWQELPDAAPPRLQALRQAEASLLQAFSARAGAILRREPQLLEAFLGDLSPEELDPVSRSMAIGALASWVVLRHRRRPRDLTAAEQLLRERRPADEQELLRAMIAAPVSLYRVEGRGGPGEVDLLDLLRGGRVRLLDYNLHRTVKEGVCLPARIYPAGPYHLAGLAGPALSPAQVPGALDFLRRAGLPAEVGDLEGSEPRFAHLWVYLAEVRRSPVHLQTTDGQPVEWSRRVYEVTDEAMLLRAFKRRADLEPGDGMFRWMGPASELAVGDTVVKAWLWLEDGRLVVVSNAAERADAVAEWVGRLRSVTYLDEEIFPAHTPPPLGPASDPAAPAPPPPSDAELAEIGAILAERVTRHCMAWLDLTLPALDGKTPRQAVTTAEGRARVQVLIRAMPDVPGVVPGRVIPIPRARMCEALGLPVEEG